MSCPPHSARPATPVPPQDHKVSEEKDEKMPNASIFTIIKEDHTLGNMIRTQLHTNKQVRFAGYKPDHPTVHQVFVKVQTEAGITPASAMSQSLRELLFTVRSFSVHLEDAVLAYEESHRKPVEDQAMLDF